MNVEKFDVPEDHSIFSEIINADQENPYEVDLEGKSIPEFMMEKYGVDIFDGRAMLALFRQLGNQGKTEELGGLYNLYRDWHEEERGKEGKE